jgi:hypothetical protein
MRAHHTCEFTVELPTMMQILVQLFALAAEEFDPNNAARLCLKSLKSFLDRVSTGSGSDLVKR